MSLHSRRRLWLSDATVFKRVIASGVLLCFMLAAPQAQAAKRSKKPAKPAPAVAPAAAPAQQAVTPPAVSAPAKSAEAAAPAAQKEVQAAPAKPASNDNFDFDLLDKKELSKADQEKAEATERSAKTRTKVLFAHQALGFTLLGVGTINFVLGVLNYYDRFGGGGYTDNYNTLHLISSITTTAVFTAAGLLALFAPDPYEKPGMWDTARVHRILMAASTAGMVANLILGIISTTRYGQLDQRDFARAHLIIGTATWAASTAGGLVYLF